MAKSCLAIWWNCQRFGGMVWENSWELRGIVQMKQRWV